MIQTIRLRSLRNATFISFTDGVVAIGTHHSLVPLGLQLISDAFAATLVPLNAQYAGERGSALTDLIEAADKRRDRAVLGIRTVTEGNLLHFDPNRVAAAEIILRIFDKYGRSIQNLPYLDQSGAMKSLADDLQLAPVTDSVNRLGLTEWVAEMKAANDAFIDLYGSRTTELGQKPSVKMLDLRQETAEAWQRLVDSVKAVHTLNPSPALSAYAAELNAHIGQYNRLINTGKEEPPPPPTE